METLLWIRFVLGILFLFAGMSLFVIEIMAVFKLDYVLDRMHAAATGDTLGIGLSLVGLMILSGWNFTTLKLALVLVFLWFSSPVASHLISRLEVETHAGKDRYEKEEKSNVSDTVQ